MISHGGSPLASATSFSHYVSPPFLGRELSIGFPDLTSTAFRSVSLTASEYRRSLLRGGGADEMLDQLEGGGRADVLGEVLTARREHARDLRPVGGDRGAGGDQVSGAVGERYRREAPPC